MKTVEIYNLHRLSIPYRLLMILLILVALTGCGVTVPHGEPDSESTATAPPMKQNTPEETIISFYQAMDSSDVALMQMLVEPTDKSNKSFLAGFRQEIAEGISSETTNIRVYIVEQTDDMVRVQVNHHQTTSKNGESLFGGESGYWFTLVKEGERWYFIGLGDPVPPGWNIE